MKVRVAPLLSLAVALAAACGGSVFTSDGSTQGGSAGAHSGMGGASTSGAASSGANAGGAIGKGGATAKGGASVGGSKANGGTTTQGGSVSQGGVIAQGGSSGFNGIGGMIYLGGFTSAGGLGGGGFSGFNGIGGMIYLGGSTSAGGFGGVGGSGGMIYLGGSTSAGGVAGAGGSAGANSGGVCRLDSDCQLGSDCCSCFAAGPGEPTSLCKAACKQSACAAAGIAESEVACVAGRCVLARSCTPSAVGCDIVEPTCPAGQLPSIMGSCYGPCIAVGECSDVPSCKVCEDADLSCVTIEAQAAPRYHCVSKPPACDKNPTCSCMGVCLRPYQCSAPESTTLTCTCPTC